MSLFCLTFGAIPPRPLSPADALLTLQVEGAVAGAVGQALPGLDVHASAVVALPALAADALPVHTEAVPGAAGVGAVSWKYY